MEVRIMWLWICLSWLSHIHVICGFRISSQNTCGGAFEGSLSFEEFKGLHSHQMYEIYPIYMNMNSFKFQKRFCSYSKDGYLTKFTDFENRQDIITEVINGRISVNFLLDATSKCEYHLENKIFSDGSIYTVFQNINNNELTFGLVSSTDTVTSVGPIDISKCTNGNFTGFLHLEIGGEEVGHRSGKQDIFKGFTGCSISDAIINNLPLSLAANLIQSTEVDDQCHFFEDDFTSVCPLTYVLKGNICVCPDLMETNEFGLCVPSCNCLQCHNGGTCVVSSADIKKPECKCPDNFKGGTCEQTINPCLGFECLHDGECVVNSESGQPECHCRSDFKGDRCEIVNDFDDPCHSSPCQHNGTCSRSSESDFLCNCSDGYDGTFCQTKLETEHDRKSWCHILGIALGAMAVLVLFLGVLINIVCLYRKKIHSASLSLCLTIKQICVNRRHEDGKSNHHVVSPQQTVA